MDGSLQDKEGHHSSALFVQWVPFQPSGSSWESRQSAYVDHLLSICDTFAPVRCLYHLPLVIFSPLVHPKI